MNRDLILKYFVEYLREKVELELISLNLYEEKNQANITLKVQHNSDQHEFTGSGVGIVDAGFNALTAHYGESFKSLNTISLSDLYFQVDHSSSRELSLKSKTMMKIEFRNDTKNKTFFSENTTSMSFTGISVLVKAFQFYMNCELLFKRLKFLIEEAENRNRSDVAAKYRYELSKVVEVTNYQSIA